MLEETMLTKIVMPSMGATMEQGTIIAWRTKEGDNVAAGAILCELETDKSTFDFESPAAGTIRKLVAQAGETIAVGGLIAIIGDPAEKIPQDWLIQPDKQAAPMIAPAVSSVIVAPQTSESDKIKISPKAKKLAAELGFDFTKVKGSGPGGIIESADIEKAAKGTHGQITPFTNMRKQINHKVTESKQQIPHFYVQSWVDMTRASAFRQIPSSQGTKISYNALLAKAIVAGLKAEPSLNTSYTPEGYISNADINVGMAIETPQGVIIAVIQNVDQKDAAGISEEMIQIIARARAGDFTGLKMTGACMTISNLGMYRVDTFIPIIHPGETAILGIGSITQRPVVRDGSIVPCLNMPVTICVDHRIADGAVAARFLETFANYLEIL
jgi:pyruvate dehydrogenase E2 component (dihydrolipoamide acetyltransferase)